MPVRSKMLTERVTIADAAQALDRTPAALHHWVRDGAFAPVDTSGRAALYSLLDIICTAKAKGASIENITMRVPAALKPELQRRLAEQEQGPESSGDEGEIDYLAEKALHERAKRELAELRLAERRALMLDANRVRAAIGSAMVAIRERMLAIETRAHGQMDAGAHAWLAVELRDALSEAADNAERLLGDRLGAPPDDWSDADDTGLVDA